MAGKNKHKQELPIESSGVKLDKSGEQFLVEEFQVDELFAALSLVGGLIKSLGHDLEEVLEIVPRHVDACALERLNELSLVQVAVPRFISDGESLLQRYSLRGESDRSDLRKYLLWPVQFDLLEA